MNREIVFDCHIEEERPGTRKAADHGRMIKYGKSAELHWSCKLDKGRVPTTRSSAP